MLAVRARALLDGRLAPSIDDVLDTGRTYPQAPYGADLHGARRRRDGRAGDRPAEVAASDNRWRRAGGNAERSSRSPGARAVKAARWPPTLPRLILEARRVAATVIHGLHGRQPRRARARTSGSIAVLCRANRRGRVDWRRSARDDHLYVREQEWEAAHTVWIWADRSPSMVFASPLAKESKLERTLVVSFALAEVLVAGGERVGIPG